MRFWPSFLVIIGYAAGMCHGLAGLGWLPSMGVLFCGLAVWCHVFLPRLEFRIVAKSRDESETK